MKERIIELLGRGIPATNVALAVGCDESYISQLLSDEATVAQVSALKMQNFSKFTEHDDSVNAAEEAALKKVQQLIPFITKPAEAVRVFAVLNAAKRKTADASSAAQSSPSTIVNVILPQVARTSFLHDHNRQVIEVDNRPLITMPAKSLVAQLEQKRAAQLLDTSVPKILDIGVSALSAKL